MQAGERTARRVTQHVSPDWVADWWMPVAPARPRDADLEALLTPQPPAVIEVVGRPRETERAAAG